MCAIFIQHKYFLLFISRVLTCIPAIGKGDADSTLLKGMVYLLRLLYAQDSRCTFILCKPGMST